MSNYITICEVGTRDGFQIEPEFIPTVLCQGGGTSCREQDANALPVVDTTNRLTEERCHRDDLDLL